MPEGLGKPDIYRIAHEALFRAERDTDEHGARRPGIEHSDDVAAIDGQHDVIEASMPDVDSAHFFGADDTDLFRRAQLDGGVYNYDD